MSRRRVNRHRCAGTANCLRDLFVSQRELFDQPFGALAPSSAVRRTQFSFLLADVSRLARPASCFLVRGKSRIMVPEPSSRVRQVAPPRRRRSQATTSTLMRESRAGAHISGWIRPVTFIRCHQFLRGVRAPVLTNCATRLAGGSKLFGFGWNRRPSDSEAAGGRASKNSCSSLTFARVGNPCLSILKPWVVSLGRCRLRDFGLRFPVLLN